jgi:hypothetical protein
MNVVHYEYRYKRPPRTKMPTAPLEVPVVVRTEPTRADDDRKPAPKSAIVTIRK